MGLYDRDFHAWALEQAERLKRRSANEIDWENIAEEIESLGNQARTEYRNRLTVLLTHLLKWMFQPQRRSRSWEITMLQQRDELAQLLVDSPSLKAFQDQLFARAYHSARLHAAKETRLSLERFPQQSPFTLQQALEDEWLPPGDASL